jgi:hypothetical protein
MVVAVMEFGRRPAQRVEAALVVQDVDRFKLDPTDREVVFYPEAAGSVGLPENLDRLSHGIPSGRSVRLNARSPPANGQYALSA